MNRLQLASFIIQNAALFTHLLFLTVVRYNYENWREVTILRIAFIPIILSIIVTTIQLSLMIVNCVVCLRTRLKKQPNRIGSKMVSFHL